MAAEGSEGSSASVKTRTRTRSRSRSRTGGEDDLDEEVATEVEKKCITIMRRELGEELDGVQQWPEVSSDLRLLRCLRGFEQDTETAIEEFRRFLRAREEFGLNDVREELVGKDFAGEAGIRQEDIPHGDVFRRFGQHMATAGYARHGHPIVYSAWGDSDTHGLLENITEEQWWEFSVTLRVFGEMQRQQLSEKLGRVIKWVIVIDLGGYSMLQARNPAWKALDDARQPLDKTDHEAVARIYVINTPGWAIPLWRIIRLAIPKRTLQKIHILGRDFREELYKDMPGATVLRMLRRETSTDAGEGVLKEDGSMRCWRGERVLSARGGTFEVRIFVDEPPVKLSWSCSMGCTATVFGSNPGEATERELDATGELPLEREVAAVSLTFVNSGWFQSSKLEYDVSCSLSQNHIQV